MSEQSKRPETREEWRERIIEKLSGEPGYSDQRGYRTEPASILLGTHPEKEARAAFDKLKRERTIVRIVSRGMGRNTRYGLAALVQKAKEERLEKIRESRPGKIAATKGMTELIVRSLAELDAEGVKRVHELVSRAAYEATRSVTKAREDRERNFEKELLGGR